MSPESRFSKALESGDVSGLKGSDIFPEEDAWGPPEEESTEEQTNEDEEQTREEQS